MFSAMLEVHPFPEQFNTYLGMAKMLRPELEKIEGFIDNNRFGSLTREGWLLSLSSWRDEKALVRWRSTAKHHQIMQAARDRVFSDYRLRIGQTTGDTHVPAGHALSEQRMDVTEVGAATAITLIDSKRDADWVKAAGAEAVAKSLGFESTTTGVTAWDVFDALLEPGTVIAVISWPDQAAAEAFEKANTFPDDVRVRQIRIIREYGMFDRREAPQYFEEAKRA